MMRLADPWVLWFLLLIPLLLWQPRVWRAAPIAFSAAWWADAGGKSIRQRLLFILPTLRALAFIALVIAAARPQWGTGEVRTQTRGIAIMAALDRSSSMLASMPTPQGERTRFEVAQTMFESFVLGDGAGTLPGRPNDLIGLVTFARYAETSTPLVRDHDTLIDIASNLQPAEQRGPEDGTSIGDALALAAARLERAEQDILARERQRAEENPEAAETPPDYEIKSKVIILLTDGDERSGQIPALDAARLAAELGIRVYAIAIGAEELIQLPGGFIQRRAARGFDQRIPRTIAEITGGRYWSADDAESLRNIYAEIDELEQSEILVTEFTNYEERFTLPAAIALVLLITELLLARTALRRES